SLKARRTRRGHDSSSGVIADVGQTSGSGSNLRRKTFNSRRMPRTRVGLSFSMLMPRKQVYHSTHSSPLTKARFFSESMEIAPIGQIATQLPHATHFCWSICIQATQV